LGYAFQVAVAAVLSGLRKVRERSGEGDPSTPPLDFLGGES
jgi:hypothetical protein